MDTKKTKAIRILLAFTCFYINKIVNFFILFFIYKQAKRWLLFLLMWIKICIFVRFFKRKTSGDYSPI